MGSDRIRQTSGDDYGRGAGDSREESAVERASDLEIEKKWLLRARVDVEKFAFFYRKYYARVYRSILLMVGDEDRARDLTDETFSQAVQKLGSFRWRGFSFGAWLFKIARHTVYRRRRYDKARPEVAFDPAQHDHGGGDRPDHQVERDDEVRVLMECLDQLKPIVKEVFVNCYGVGMTAREIGIVMDMPEATVYSHLKRGRKELRALLIAGGVERALSPRVVNTIQRSKFGDEGWRILEGENE